MSVFADFEPEDAWDATDDMADQLENLRARVRLLLLMPVFETLDDIADGVLAARRSRVFDARDELRADQLDEDIAFVRARLAVEFG